MDVVPKGDSVLAHTFLWWLAGDVSMLVIRPLQVPGISDHLGSRIKMFVNIW